MRLSQWTRAYRNAVSQSNINKNWSAKKRANCKACKLANLLQVHHLPLTCFSTKFLMDNCVVFDASHNQQHIDWHKNALVIDVSELEIIDTTKGTRLVPAGSEADTPVFVLVPWEEVVVSGKQVDVSSLIAALETLESNNKVSLQHGKSRYVGHASSGTNYMCSGVAPNCGRKGIHESSIKDLPEAQWKGLIKFVQKCEHLLIGYLNSGVLKGFQNAIRFGTLWQCQDLLEHKNASIFGAISSRRNVFLSSHMDEDFSILLLQCRKRKVMVHSTQWMMTFVIILCSPSMVWQWLSTLGMCSFSTCWHITL